MKIESLEIKSKFKNLNNIKIDFNTEHFMTVIVGRNGSGKSNVLEALVSIFRNLDLGESPLFSYEIVYSLEGDGRQKTIKVIADHTQETLSKQYKIEYSTDRTTWTKVAISKVKRDKEGQSVYLPRHVFAYYSGPSDRLENYFIKHRSDFYYKLLKNQLDIQGEMRPMFYAKPVHSQFVLLAFFLDQEDTEGKDFLKDYMGIESLESVHFILRKPGWAKKENENDIFWGADGVVRQFLDKLLPQALAPIKVNGEESSGFLAKKGSNEFLHLKIPSYEKLMQVSDGLSVDHFFKMLESTLLSELLAEVRIHVKVKNVDEVLSFRELSEGEQQLLTLLGLLKFTGGKDSLFLLDEPDTHLNPSWTVDYFKFLEQFTENKESTQVMLATHHPLAIAELKKERVKIMWKNEAQKVMASEPLEDPIGMGYGGLLTSELFGLRSDLDSKTLKLLDEHAILLAKDDLTPIEKERIKTLKDELDKYGFLEAYSDPYFSAFVKAWKNREAKTIKQRRTLSQEDLAKLSSMADDILAEIEAEEKDV
ncbi:AAA family ATPase [Sulfurimonas sp. HSL1-6]|uniref:AAA family ATPase n=1 Tax=Thiomicrolovo immobilis TaxID=3131935 RepID=UPI0031FA0676